MTLDVEEWCDILGFEGRYQISNMGRVRSLLGKNLRILRLNMFGNYLSIRLLKHGKCYGFNVHRLVAIAFLPDFEPRLEVDHIDGNKINNRATNLRMATHSQNLCNRKAQKNNTAGAKGVSFDKSTNRWIASITVGGKQTTLGRYSTVKEAKKVYSEFALKYHDKFARVD